MTCRIGAPSCAALILILLTIHGPAAARDGLPPVPPSVLAQMEQYDTLPAAGQQARVARGLELRRAAEASRHGPRRLDWLRQAAEAAPSDPAVWLALSDQQLLMGYEEEGALSLAIARAALDRLPAERQEDAAGDLALAMAWWHYRRAEWTEGQEWARVAIRRRAGLSGHLVLLLNRAQPEAHRENLREPMAPFLPLNGGGNRAADVAWIYALNEHFHLDWLPPDRAAQWKRRDTAFYDHDVQRWRDFGVRSESHEYDGSAIDYYRKSLRALPCPEGGWLSRHERRIPVLEKPMDPMPFWTNPDDGYVTGSQLAYLGWLRDRMLAARDPLEADRLAGLVQLHHDRITARSHLYAWPELWMAEALLELDQDEDAMLQLRGAIDTFASWKQSDPALERLQGRLLSRGRNWGGALPLLQKAVRDFPDDPGAWSDLAVAEADRGHWEEADRAFARALALDMNRVETWRARGRAARARGDLQSAQADFERALQLAPGDTTLREELMAAAQRAAENIRN